MYPMKLLLPIRIRARGLAVCFLAAFTTVALFGQTESTALWVRGAGTTDPALVIRDIHDPSSGARWLLVRNPACPDGPGRLLLVSSGNFAAGRTGEDQVPLPEPSVPVIRAGDPITLEVHNGTTDIWLEAVALIPARFRAPLLARTKAGGRTVHAFAAGHGRAILTGIEVWQ
jgi:hypothetical protein